MLAPESAFHLTALCTVAAAVFVQSLVTREAGADRNRQASDFGVRLLATELADPVTPMNRAPLVTPPSAGEPTGSAATLLTSTTTPPPARSAKKPRRRWLDVEPFELRQRAVPYHRSLDRLLLNRDATGSLIELTENDVLIPVRLEP